MEARLALPALLVTVGLALGALVAQRYPVEWVLIMGAAGLGFGALSSLV